MPMSPVREGGGEFSMRNLTDHELNRVHA